MTVLKGNIEIELVDRGSVTLRPSNYITTGGEGSIYRLNDTIIKLFTDSKKMAHDEMGEKIKMLSHLTHPQIVRPLGLVIHKGREVGYYMNYVSAEPLTRMFTNDFIVRSSISHSDTSYVVEHMRDIVRAAHKGGVVMVDANELNWLVALRPKNSPLPYVIDVDSWAIGKWGASVIMPSIRDWHATTFDHKSDWFAWGVVTFQLFTGIHPYKGTLLGYERGKIEERMKTNASVFSQGIQLNRAVRDFSLIPKGLCAWYEAVFQNGKREEPPENFDQVVAYNTQVHVYHKTFTKTCSISYTKLFYAGKNSVLRVFPSGVVACSDGALVEMVTKKEIGHFFSKNIELVETEHGYIVLDWQNGKSVCTFIDAKTLMKEEIKLPCDFRVVVRFENRLFGVTEQGLSELSFRKFAHMVCSIKTTWSALPQSTDWFEGFGVQKTLTKAYVIFPTKEDACVYLRVPELDELVLLQGMRGASHISTVGLNRKGEMLRRNIYFSKDYKSYQHETVSVDTTDITQVTLPKGVCVEIREDGKLSASVPGSGKETVVEDRDIMSDARLYSKGNTVLYVRKGTVWGISML